MKPKSVFGKRALKIEPRTVHSFVVILLLLLFWVLCYIWSPDLCVYTLTTQGKCLLSNYNRLPPEHPVLASSKVCPGRNSQAKLIFAWWGLLQFLLPLPSFLGSLSHVSFLSSTDTLELDIPSLKSFHNAMMPIAPSESQHGKCFSWNKTY